jgi:hypothetical protein
VLTRTIPTYEPLELVPIDPTARVLAVYLILDDVEASKFVTRSLHEISIVPEVISLKIVEKLSSVTPDLSAVVTVPRVKFIELVETPFQKSSIASPVHSKRVAVVNPAAAQEFPATFTVMSPVGNFAGGFDKTVKLDAFVKIKN